MNLDHPSGLHVQTSGGPPQRPREVLLPFDDVDWERRKLVTTARAIVVLLIAALYLASTLPVGGDSDLVRAVANEQVRWFVGPIVLYALTVGLVSDHLASRVGPLLALVVHYGAMTVFFAGVVAVGANAAHIAYDGVPTLVGWGSLPFLFSLYALLAYVVAWAVPGSFSRSVGFTRAVARAVAHPVRTRRRFMDGTPDRPAVWPSVEARTDWL